MRALIAVIAATAALGVVLTAGAGSSAASQSCGNYAGSPVYVNGDVPCRKAKAIVKEFHKTRKSSIQGFQCGGSSSKVNCRTSGKKISWKQ